MITHQLQEVLLTYVRRVTAGGWPIFIVLIAVAGAIEIAILPLKSLGGVIWMAMYGPGLVAMHLKQQLVHSRERRLPAAIVAHVVVACLILLLIAIGVPALRMAMVGPWCWGYPGFVLALVGFTVAATMSQASWIWFVVPFLVWGMLSSAAQKIVLELCNGHQEEFGIRLFAFGIGMVAIAIVWTLRLTEEDRGYQVFWAGKPGDLYRRDAVQTAQSEAVKQMWKRRWFWPREPSAARMAQWPVWAQGSLWDRIRLCEAGRMMSAMQWIIFFCFPLFFLVPAWMMNRAINFNNLYGFNTAFFVPAMIVIGQWYQQHPVWGIELLRPVARNRYLQVSGLTLALWTALAWTMQVLCWIVIAATVPAGVNWPKLWTSIGISGAIQCLLFALGVWIMRYRSVAIWMATLVAVIVVSSMIAAQLTIFGNTPSHPATVLLFAAVVVVVSGGITYDAYRRWLNTELG
jgi:hypothetical protein